MAFLVVSADHPVGGEILFSRFAHDLFLGVYESIDEGENECDDEDEDVGIVIPLRRAYDHSRVQCGSSTGQEIVDVSSGVLERSCSSSK